MCKTKLRLSVNAEKLSSLLSAVSDAKKSSPFTEQFTERFQFLLDIDDLLVKAGVVNLGDSSATTSNGAVFLEPTDSFLSLCTAFLAGDGDFSIFDHKYSFSKSIDIKQ